MKRYHKNKKNKTYLTAVTVLFIFALFISASFAQEKECADGATSNYYGVTGLIRTPSARVVDDGVLRLTTSQAYPYREYALCIGILPTFELNARVDEILSDQETGPAWMGYGNRKHRSADVKWLLIKEGRFTPAISAGMLDIGGSAQIFHSEYVAASKRVNNFDFSLGCGGNLFGTLFKQANTAYRELDGVFGGVSWRLHPKISAVAEYDPTNRLASFNYDVINSHINYGIKFNPIKDIDISVTRQRNAAYGLSFSFGYPFGGQILPQKQDPQFVYPVDRSPLPENEEQIKVRLEKIRSYVAGIGAKQVKVFLTPDKKEIYVEYENVKYASEAKALGRVLRVCAAQYPENIEKINAVIKLQNVPITGVSLNPKNFAEFLNGNISSEDMYSKIEICENLSNYENEKNKIINSNFAGGKAVYPDVSISARLVSIEPYINDRTGFFKGRVGPMVRVDKLLSEGFTFNSLWRFPVYSNISTNAPPLMENPVRTDFIKYIANKVANMPEGYLNKYFRTGSTGFARATGGYTEYMYAAGAAEYLKTVADGKFGFGAEVTYAVKRQPDNYFDLMNFKKGTAFVKGYTYFPRVDAALEARAGRYLAGDIGGGLIFTRYLNSGNIRLWYTKTNTANFSGQNNGYADFGISFSVPIKSFQDHDCKGSYYFPFSPWTRDVCQTVGQPNVRDFIYPATPACIKAHWKEILE